MLLRRHRLPKQLPWLQLLHLHISMYASYLTVASVFPLSLIAVPPPNRLAACSDLPSPSRQHQQLDPWDEATPQ